MNHLQKYELVKQASGGAAGRVLELVTQGGPKGRKLLKELLPEIIFLKTDIDSSKALRVNSTSSFLCDHEIAW